MLVLEFTGERVVPGRVDADLWNEHLSRYLFATRVARGKRVIDLGCGAGYGTAELARTAASVIGIDLAADAVDWASSQYTSSNIRFQQASCDNVPIEDASVDLAVSFEVIEHLEQPETLLAEARRILAADGLFIVSTPNIDYYAEAREEIGPNPYHHHEFSFDEFQETLLRYFSHVTIYTQNHVPAVAFQPIKGSTSAPVIRMQKAATSTDIASAYFYIAVCSQTPFTGLPGFFYLPSTGNVLREREKHIVQLKNDLTKAIALFRQKEEELEKTTEWARTLDQDIQQARSRITELEDEKVFEQKKVAEILTARDTELEDRTRWALDLDSRLQRMISSRWYQLGRKFNLGPDIG